MTNLFTYMAKRAKTPDAVYNNDTKTQEVFGVLRANILKNSAVLAVYGISLLSANPLLAQIPDTKPGQEITTSETMEESLRRIGTFNIKQLESLADHTRYKDDKSIWLTETMSEKVIPGKETSRIIAWHPTIDAEGTHVRVVTDEKNRKYVFPIPSTPNVTSREQRELDWVYNARYLVGDLDAFTAEKLPSKGPEPFIPAKGTVQSTDVVKEPQIASKVGDENAHRTTTRTRSTKSSNYPPHSIMIHCEKWRSQGISDSKMAELYDAGWTVDIYSYDNKLVRRKRRKGQSTKPNELDDIGPS